MMVDYIREYPGISEYIQKRGLTKQFINSKKKLLSGNIKAIDFKLRRPKSDAIWYWRINKKYRAYGFFEGNVLLVYHIDDHQ